MARDVASALQAATAEVMVSSIVELDVPLATQGIDSLAAQEIVDILAERHGLLLPHAKLLVGTIRSLADECVQVGRAFEAIAACPVSMDGVVLLPLTGPQTLWASLDVIKGWGAWANISLCVSLPASRTPPAYLAAMAQSLCDANDTLRSGFVRMPIASTVPTHQRIHASYAVPVQMHPTPLREADALRMAHGFEGEEISPYAPTARALVLAGGGATAGARHWLCLTVHHAFCDRAGMRLLHAQLRLMLGSNEMRIAPPFKTFASCALSLEHRGERQKESQQASIQEVMRGVSLPTVCTLCLTCVRRAGLERVVGMCAWSCAVHVV